MIKLSGRSFYELQAAVKKSYTLCKVLLLPDKYRGNEQMKSRLMSKSENVGWRERLSDLHADPNLECGGR